MYSLSQIDWLILSTNCLSRYKLTYSKPFGYRRQSYAANGQLIIYCATTHRPDPFKCVWIAVAKYVCFRITKYFKCYCTVMVLQGGNIVVSYRQLCLCIYLVTKRKVSASEKFWVFVLRTMHYSLGTTHYAIHISLYTLGTSHYAIHISHYILVTTH